MTMIGLRLRGGAPEGDSAREVAEIHYRAVGHATLNSWRETFVKPLRMFPPDDPSNPLLARWKAARAAAQMVRRYIYADTIAATETETTLAFSRLDENGQAMAETARISLVLEDGAWRVESAHY